MSTEYEIHQSEEYKGENWWEWAVWIEASDQALDQIEFVEWTLHPSFPNPVRKIKDRSTKFKLETAGWGVFPIRARVWVKSGESISLSHYLELKFPDGTLNTA